MKKKVWQEMTLEEKIAFLEECAAAAEARFKRNWSDEKIQALNAKIASGGRLSVEDFEMYTGIKFSHDMTGKMEKILGLSTCCLLNPLCRARIEKNVGICAECFAESVLLARQGLTENTCYNYKLLSTVDLPVEIIPYIDAAELRLESYGDVGNIIQAKNYIKIGLYNPHCAVTVWTKNPALYHAAFQELGLDMCPANFTVILSSQYMNVEAAIPEKYAYFIRKTFTVYTAEWLTENKKTSCFINCGGRKCRDCKRCYTGAVHSEKHIREILKKDTNKMEKAGFTWYDSGAPIAVREMPAAVDFSGLFH